MCIYHLNSGICQLKKNVPARNNILIIYYFNNENLLFIYVVVNVCMCWRKFLFFDNLTEFSENDSMLSILKYEVDRKLPAKQA